MLLRRPVRDVHDESAPPRDHRRRGQLRGAVVRAHAGVEHLVPAPERLFPEWFRPRELAILHHVVVAAPDVVDEDVDAALAQDARERRVYLRVDAVIATDGGDSAALAGFAG